MRFSTVLAGFALAGLALAIYDAYDILTQNFSSCNISSWLSCGAVFLSGHSSLAGVPFWAMGIVWFVFISSIVFWKWKAFERNPQTYILLIPILMIGNIFTIYLWYLQIVIIHAYCPVCITMYFVSYAMTGTLIFYSIR